MLRRWPWILGALVTLGLGGWLLWPGGGTAPYVTSPVEHAPLTVTVGATGTLEPVDEVEIGAEITGRIVEIGADYNAHVTAGQVLARLDTALLEAKVKQSAANRDAARAGIAEAQAALTLAQAKARRSAALVERRVVSPQDHEINQAEAARTAAALQVAEAQAAVAEAVLASDASNLDKATIRSPVDGIVIARNVELGQTIVAALQTPVLFTVARDLTAMELHLDVDEADIGLVAEGQQASFSVDAYPTRRFAASLTSVRLAPKTEQGVVTYQVLARVANPDLALRPGMTATADITTRTVPDALLVPNGALRFTPPGADRATPAALPPDRGRLWLDDEGGPRAVVVGLGLSDGRRTAVTADALMPGDPVIVDLARTDGSP